MKRWELTYEGYDPAQERLREALCTLANGYFGTRGAAPESSAGGPHYPGTYVAGLYNRLTTPLEGRNIENEDMVNVPNWLPLTFRVGDGPWFTLDDVDVLDYRQTLELRRGVLVRNVRFRDIAGRETSLADRRFVHMAYENLAAIEMTIRPENWSGEVTVRSALDGAVCNTGVARYRALANRHLDVIETAAPSDDTVMLRARTIQSRVEVVEAARTRVYDDSVEAAAERRSVIEADTVAHELTFPMVEGEPRRIEKVVALFTTRDLAIPEPGRAAVLETRQAGSFDELLDRHVLEWDELWRRFALQVEGAGADVSQALNVHLFHLLGVAAPTTMQLDVGIPARGLHGEAYRGHIFWDELFIFPLLNHRVPEIARNLLLYRFHRLPAAKRAAHEAGYEGAMFPWQSGSSGREESQTIHLNPRSGRWLPDDSHRQRHIGSAIAYNVWQFFHATGDVEFMARAGTELVIEIARFWASIATYDRVDDRYDINGVVGPDEFHDHDPNWDGPGLRNNAYTNVMASWVLTHAPLALEPLPGIQREGIVDRLGLRREELEQWDEVSRKLRVPFHDGVISQFEGYADLEELDWTAYYERYADIQRLDRLLEAEDDNINRYKASKQADVLMLLYLLSRQELAAVFMRLGYELDDDLVQRTIDYYLARTSHGSTLSQVVHSWVVAASDRPRSFELFQRSVQADLSDVQGGTTAEGIHLGAMAGTVDLVERGYSGMEVREGHLRFDPSLPVGIDLVEFKVYYQQRWITVALAPDRLDLTSEVTERPAVTVSCHGELVDLESGATVTFPR